MADVLLVPVPVPTANGTTVTDGVLPPSGTPLAVKTQKFASRIDEYCHALDGVRPIHSVLIANNGIAAVKFIRSIRSWAIETFGVERAVLMVAMATPEDMRVNAEHIRMADRFVEVPGGTNNNNYANVQLIVEVAERTGVDAVWPGWGHASEIPDLPEALMERGIIFLGPPAEPMAALGDKIGSSLIAQAANVPTLTWSGSNVHLPLDNAKDPIPSDIYEQACVHTTEEAVASCAQIGYPAMIKASWGGGGKGIRKVHNEEEVQALFKQVQGEVPGSPIFIMKLASQSNHLEVQLVCDEYGNVAALHSRDCSVQRRHQKIIEEGPITVAPLETIHQLERGACRLAKSVGYVGCATVEYLYSTEKKEFYFLELNPRLQVEHPVTEWIAGVNLPATQLAVGMGIPLWRLPELRRLYGQPAGGGTNTWQVAAREAVPFDFDTVPQVPPRGHVVAVRVTSEDPDDGFKPTSGRVQELSFRSKPDVWAYFSIKSGGGIHEFSDSQFGHLFAFGETRQAAIANQILTLNELHIRGEIRTNVDYTVDLLKAEEFAGNRIHTGWLDSRIAMKVVAERPPWHISVLGGALREAEMMTAARVSEYVGYLQKGQIPPKHISLVNFDVSLNIEGVKYTVSLIKRARASYLLKVNDSEVAAEVHTLRDGGLLIQLDGSSHVLYSEEEAMGTRLLIDGRTCLLQNDHDPSQLVAETPCKLMRYLVPDGGHVRSDEAYAEVEVMKMCMPLLAPAAGTLRFRMAEGAAMAAGDLIARLDLDDPSAVRKAAPFDGSLPPLGPPAALGGKVHQRCARAIAAARHILAGYSHTIEQVVHELLETLRDPMLPWLQWADVNAVLATRLPKDLRSRLEAVTSALPLGSPFPADEVLLILESSLEELPERESSAQARVLAPMVELVASYTGGLEGHARGVVKELFEEYAAVEELFSQKAQADAIEVLRQQHKKDLSRVVDIVLSHQGVKQKNALVIRLLDLIVVPFPQPFREVLLRFSALQHSDHAEVALKAGHLQEETNLTELRNSIVRSLSDPDLSALAGEAELSAHGGSGSLSQRFSPRSGSAATLEERMELLVDAPQAIEDALATLFDHGDGNLQARALETYIMRLYQPYLVKGSVAVAPHKDSSLKATWRFWEENPAPTPAGLSSQAPGDANRGVQRWGAMVVATSLAQAQDALRSAISDVRATAPNAQSDPPAGTNRPLARKKTFVGTPSGLGNVLHVALVTAEDALPGQSLGGAADGKGDEAAARDRVKQLQEELLHPGIGHLLHATGVEVVSCLVHRDDGKMPARHCFHWSPSELAYLEQPLLRHVEPPLADLLELVKLKSFPSMRYARSRDRQWHMYSTIERPATRRLFLRALVRQPQPSSETNLFSLAPHLDSPPPSGKLSDGQVDGFGDGSLSTPSAWGSSGGLESPRTPPMTPQVAVNLTIEGLLWAMMGALEELDLAAHDASGRADHVHMFLAVLGALHLPQADFSEAAAGGAPVGGDVEAATRRSVEAVSRALETVALAINTRLGARMHRLAVSIWEVRIRVKEAGRASGAWRAIVANPSGHACSIEVYREVEDPVHGVPAYFSPFDPPKGGLHGKPLSAPYPALHSVERRRLAARRNNTTYCYDFLMVFEEALKEAWAAATAADPALRAPEGPVLEAKELVLASEAPEGSSSVWDAPLVECRRPMGSNTVGMVAWSLHMVTPECPSGRTVLVVVNDVTHGAGSFGVREDAVFKAVTDRAAAERLPLVYLAANSGARIGVAEEVRAAFRVGWADDASPARGFQYLYISDGDYARLKESVVAVEAEGPGGERRWRVTDIIGADDGLGVENLSGSGAIAGAFSRAYRETFTLTFVTGRTVGIGAYLARLGIRCIQREDQPIILTGYSALNKLLGREVYSSHMQLGGPKIMAVNGVSHATVLNDYEGVAAILRWLSYVPPVIGGPLPCVRPLDPPEREVEYEPEQACDPRAAIAGVMATAGETDGGGGERWLGGMFDRGSFTECLQGWAQTVVIGRARLGGIPVGVVAVEVQTVMMTIPADPGSPDSHERVVAQAGQVWFPDSAAKTARAMADFDREGLPLFVLANWRGFSGGQRDLYEGVLQAGSLIVDQLRVYGQPVFVYIPRGGELRGGAWVVVDSQINADKVEMFADDTARGGVLEPEGMIEIKFRTRELLECMHRLDGELAALDRQVKDAAGGPPDAASAARLHALQHQIKAREKLLLPVYKQVATKFAELHDTPRRMQAKGVIQAIVPWRASRAFFHRRLVRRLAEEDLMKQVQEAGGGDAAVTRAEARRLLQEWFAGCQAAGGGGGGGQAPGGWEQDEAFIAWAQDRDPIEARLESMRAERVAAQLADLGLMEGGAKGLRQGLATLLASVGDSERAALAKQLREVIDSSL